MIQPSETRRRTAPVLGRDWSLRKTTDGLGGTGGEQLDGNRVERRLTHTPTTHYALIASQPVLAHYYPYHTRLFILRTPHDPLCTSSYALRYKNSDLKKDGCSMRIVRVQQCRGIHPRFHDSDRTGCRMPVKRCTWGELITRFSHIT